MANARTLRLETHHRRARTTGVNPLVYRFVRALIEPFFLVYFRLERHGREHLPADGPVIVAANHRSFLDPFVIGVASRRPLYYVAKQELFAHPLVAWILNALGAFPVARGTGDGDMLATAKAILARGVGRLALETGAPVVPVAIIGTEAVRRGWRIRPHRVRVRVGPARTFPRVDVVSPGLAQAVTNRIWPAVEEQWALLGGAPPERRSDVAAMDRRRAA